MKTKTIERLILVGAMLSVLMLFERCKKEETKPADPIQAQASNQNEKLIATWIRDSVKIDGGTTSVDIDTCYITKASIHEITHLPSSIIEDENQWTTKGDSLIESFSGIDGNHYKYSVTSQSLFLYLNGDQIMANVKYWYHKK